MGGLNVRLRRPLVLRATLGNPTGGDPNISLKTLLTRVFLVAMLLLVNNERDFKMWASQEEIDAKRLAETDHPNACPECGSDPGHCYFICPNHPEYFTAEQEKEEALWQEGLSDSEYMSLAVSQYEAIYGEGSYCS